MYICLIFNQALLDWLKCSVGFSYPNISRAKDEKKKTFVLVNGCDLVRLSATLEFSTLCNILSSIDLIPCLENVHNNLKVLLLPTPTKILQFSNSTKFYVNDIHTQAFLLKIRMCG